MAGRSVVRPALPGEGTDTMNYRWEWRPPPEPARMIRCRKFGTSATALEIRKLLSAPPGEAMWRETLGRRLAELLRAEE